MEKRVAKADKTVLLIVRHYHLRGGRETNTEVAKGEIGKKGVELEKVRGGDQK